MSRAAQENEADAGFHERDRAAYRTRRSIREIARAADLLLAGLYHYVGGKDELMLPSTTW
jgi:hypothetical protein